MTTPKRRSAFTRLLPWLVVFVLGGAAGYYVRDRQAHDRMQETVEQTRRQMERAALEAIGRAQRAGSDFGAGAEAAAESTKAAFRELTGR